MTHLLQQKGSAEPTEELAHREMTEQELEAISGGDKGSTASGHMYLVFNFKLVAVKTVS